MREAYSTQLAMVAGALMFLVAVLFALLQSPEATMPPARSAPVLPHPLEGFARCDSCHTTGEEYPYPIRHLGWDEKSCLKCHVLQ